MQAIVQDGYGLPDDVLELRSSPLPAIADDEVLLRVHAAPIAGDDWHLVQGEPYIARVGLGLTRPRTPTPGADVAGRIEIVGRYVRTLRPGQAVFGWCRGAHAEYAAAKASELVLKPSATSFEEASSIPTSGATALQALRAAGVGEPGARVLILGASGGVGTLATQMARALGAHVTGVCGAASAQLVRDLGAHEVLDHARDDFADGSQRWDAIIYLGGNRSVSDCRRALGPEGSLVLVGGAGGRVLGGVGRWVQALAVAPFVRQRLVPLVHERRRDDLVVLAKLLESGRLRPVVSAKYGLDSFRDALRHFPNGHGRGKVVLTP